MDNFPPGWGELMNSHNVYAMIVVLFTMLLLVSLVAVFEGQRARMMTRAEATGITIVLLALAIVGLILLTAYGASARDVDGRYASSPLHDWFEGLRSGKGPCCSDADGTALSDVDWESKSDHYRVRIEGQWWDVPDEAVLTEPNRAGRTMVWPIYHRNPGLTVEIRCFIPGSMT